MKKVFVMVATCEDKKLSIRRTNKGFNSFELMGLIENSLLDIRDQIQGKVKPDIITRRYIEKE